MASFAMPLRLLGTPPVLNQISFVWNFVFVKFWSVCKGVKKGVSTILQNCFSFGFIIKNNLNFPHIFLLSTSTKIFMLQNKNVLSKLQTYFCFLLSNFCASKISLQYHEIYETWSSLKWGVFLQKLSNYLYNSAKFPLIFFACRN